MNTIGKINKFYRKKLCNITIDKMARLALVVREPSKYIITKNKIFFIKFINIVALTFEIIFLATKFELTIEIGNISIQENM